MSADTGQHDVSITLPSPVPSTVRQATVPTAEQVRDDRLFVDLGLTATEYDRVVALLGRLPNYLETSLFGVLWSEHCSYKSSRIHLAMFPTTAPHVLQGPGENAGVIDIGDGMAIAFKMESHNHPSAVEPFQGAATGVGGILRDVFTMGARPIAFLNSLRFGSLDDARTRYLFANVVAGISFYGNCVGIPDVGGEAVFDDAYQHNPLVNAMCVGLLPTSGIVRGSASGVGNPVFVIGSRTGRDGIHGATFASVQDPTEKERSAVQVGNPFLGKLLLEACLELIQTGAVVGIQDMGAAGLTSSAAEMASRAGGGLELDLDRVPVRETGMTPYDMMLSESQERMLVVLDRGREEEAFAILRRWGLQVAQVGTVTGDHLLRLRFGGETVAEVPVRALVDEAPRYDRPADPPQTRAGVHDQPAPVAADAGAALRALQALLSHPSIADKRWIYRQYDTTVRVATLVGPGSDAAVVRIGQTDRAVALCTDGNGRYVALHPRRGGAIAVAEAARNIACSGGRALAITDCLNFGNPEEPAVMRQLIDAIAGMSEACRALGVPVVSGNVSLYNESGGVDIHPTPVVGAVGVIDALAHITPNRFCRPGSTVLLLGVPDLALAGSLYWQLHAGRPAGDAPRCDLAAEAALHALLQELTARGAVLAAHDLSDGGFAVALAEMCIDSNIGVTVDAALAGLPAGAGAAERTGWLFSEAQGRVLVEVAPADVASVQARAQAAAVPALRCGQTGGDNLVVTADGSPLLRASVAALADVYRSAIPRRMGREEEQSE